MNIDLNEIVKIEQMPKVFEQLELIGQFVDDYLKDLDGLECTNSNKQMIKKRRTEINKMLTLLEDKRKEIKAKINEPYETFNSKYELEAKNKLQDASEILKKKIYEIETEEINEKITKGINHCEKYLEFYNLNEFGITYDSLNISVNLSTTEKSMKTEIEQKLEKISTEIKLINVEEFPDEVLLEYLNNGYDYASARLKVMSRKASQEELKAKQERMEQFVEVNKEQEKKIEQIIIGDNGGLDSEPIDDIKPPKEIRYNEYLIEVSFTVHAYKDQLEKLKQFMVDNNIEYE